MHEHVREFCLKFVRPRNGKPWSPLAEKHCWLFGIISVSAMLLGLLGQKGCIYLAKSYTFFVFLLWLLSPLR